MAYVLASKRGAGTTLHGSLAKFSCDRLVIYSKGLDKSAVDDVYKAYRSGNLGAYLNATLYEKFLIVVDDSSTGDVVVCNDKFSTNEIFFFFTKNGIVVSDSIADLRCSAGVHLEIDLHAVRESVLFCTILPPRTVYKGVHAVPMGSMLTYSSGRKVNDWKIERYWRLEHCFSPKFSSYEELIAESRSVLEQELKRDLGPNLGVSLSGGIDSGGLLAMATKQARQKLPSVSVGARGPETVDLISARQTVTEIGSDNHEVYPVRANMMLIPAIMGGMNQPAAADYLLGNAIIFERAKQLGIHTILNGSGVQMVLGDLRLPKFAYYMRWFDFMPRALLRFPARLFNLSNNKKEILLATRWSKRFVRTVAPRLSDEILYYTDECESFAQSFEDDLRDVVGPQTTALLDHIVMMYVLSWINYQQYRDIGALARQYDIEVAIPFDSPRVANVLFRVPDKWRSRGGWNKQVIRDIYRPYISQRLYAGKVRSLIIPYTSWFEGETELVFKYLKNSWLVSSLVDLERYERGWPSLPEPGISLVRLLGVAAWYEKHEGSVSSLFMEQLAPLFTEKTR